MRAGRNFGTASFFKTKWANLPFTLLWGFSLKMSENSFLSSSSFALVSLIWLHYSSELFVRKLFQSKFFIFVMNELLSRHLSNFVTKTFSRNLSFPIWASTEAQMGSNVTIVTAEVFNKIKFKGHKLALSAEKLMDSQSKEIPVLGEGTWTGGFWKWNFEKDMQVDLWWRRGNLEEET